MRSEYLPKINTKATKKEVEKVLFKYRDYLITIPNYLMPKITATYTMAPPSNTNEFHSSTEDTAIERIVYEQERNSYLTWIYDAVNSLKEDERQIVIKKYLLHNECGYDREIMIDLGVGKTKYYEIKAEGLLRLAFILKIEVYKKREVIAS